MAFYGLITSFAETNSGGFSALGIDPLAILAQEVTFIVLLVLIKKYALDKIVVALEKRQKAIADSLQNANDIEAQKSELEKKIAKMLEDARSEAEDMLNKAGDDARQRLLKAEEFAKLRAEDILNENQLRIATEMAKARRELKNEVADLVADTTGEILHDSLSVAQEKKLIDIYLKETKK